MKQVISVGAIVLSLSFLGGCATSTISPSQAAIPEEQRVYWDDAAANSYTLKITRDTGQMGSLCTTRLAIDDELAADIHPGESVTFKVPAGKHEFSAWQISGGKWGAGFCDKNPMRQDISVSRNSGENITYRYSYAGSGLPSLTTSSANSP
ncbi:MAG: hypothetical protein DRR42_12805 [Gammaproteobacteria bacterium]|nr:MAG: hypothetical protein DRR42_12805 [Gammaproteobacteria bacterium]